MGAERHDSPWPKLVWGAVLLSAGLIFWFDQMGRVDADQFLRWWPVAVIAGGLSQAAARRWAAGAVWIAVGVFFLLPKLGYPIQAWRVIGLWPLLFSAAGVVLITHALRRPEKERRGDTFRSVAVAGANNRIIRSPRFAGGEAVAFMAGSEIDIAPSRAPDEPPVIDVLAFWGGIEIRIPAGWRAINEVAAILGGYEDKTTPAPDGAPSIIIRGAAIMASVEVKNLKEGRG